MWVETLVVSSSHKLLQLLVQCASLKQNSEALQSILKVNFASFTIIIHRNPYKEYAVCVQPEQPATPEEALAILNKGATKLVVKQSNVSDSYFKELIYWSSFAW